MGILLAFIFVCVVGGAIGGVAYGIIRDIVRAVRKHKSAGKNEIKC